ncbi:hypothetical protein M0L20_29745 [Spirosoma sp. RP8]|uniref:Bacteriocin n=1 Tax=Spirosoma liriopis TaxID=2937440 RepID=A0ABT0HW37_9BACT|nr:hypothetical protein [Spirosoma liriopis]MCK8496087.1 hypothetical protein [Spirosoma liriopis]
MENKSGLKKLSINKDLIEKLNNNQEQLFGGYGNTVVVNESAVCSGICESAICSSTFCGSHFACGTTVCAADPGGCGNYNCVGITINR